LTLGLTRRGAAFNISGYGGQFLTPVVPFGESLNAENLALPDGAEITTRQ
jgi:hypothetical protein